MEDNRTIVLRESEMSVAPETTGMSLVHQMQVSPRARTYTILIVEREGSGKVLSSIKPSDGEEI